MTLAALPLPLAVGERYGHLTVIGEAESLAHYGRRLRFRCDCGAEIVRIASQVRAQAANGGPPRCSLQCPKARPGRKRRSVPRPAPPESATRLVAPPDVERVEPDDDEGEVYLRPYSRMPRFADDGGDAAWCEAMWRAYRSRR